MKLKFHLIFVCAFLAATAAAAQTPVSVLASSRAAVAVPEAAIIRQMRANFDVESYREVRGQVIFNPSGDPDHLLVFLLANGTHRMDFARVDLDPQYQFHAIDLAYHLQPNDIAQQTGSAAQAKCPDSSVEFISFAPNNHKVEQNAAKAVAKAAMKRGLKTVTLLKTQATRQNYLNYMVCPNLKGNFYDGDSGPNSFTTVDGFISSTDISSLPQPAFRFKVVNIWVACQAYNIPMLPAVEVTAEAQKYAAGINDLFVGPSDRAAVCGMKAAIAGKPMTKAFHNCVEEFDPTSDKWGFGGEGSDLFGQ